MDVFMIDNWGGVEQGKQSRYLIQATAYQATRSTSVLLSDILSSYRRIKIPIGPNDLKESVFLSKDPWSTWLLWSNRQSLYFNSTFLIFPKKILKAETGYQNW